MALRPGDRLGPYEVLEAAGSGGMGEVYKARDVRLGRTVALKTLTRGSESDPAARSRFEREARVIAGLNHPHICAIHDVGEWDGQAYLVMEFLDGETLQQRVARSALSRGELLKLAVQIASALVAAHRAGVVHRDLKPSNVMLTRAGVKLLDFGIATQRVQLEPAPSGDATVTEFATTPGQLVGTVAYMAPEQLEDRPTDQRTDIFAFGALLFEMATRRPAFEGSSIPALIAAIMSDSRRQFAPEQLDMPRALERIVSTCLAKDPDDRFQHTADLLRELQWAQEDLSHESEPAGSSSRRRWGIHGLWAAMLVAAVSGTWLTSSRNRTAPPTPPPNPTPVVVLMDSPLPGRVYDPRTAAAGGTNADDVTDVLRDLPIAIRKENTSAVWHREEQVIAERPDVIIGHLSCLFDARVADALTPAYEHVFQQAKERLLMFFAYAAARNPRTRFIVYSRSVFQESGGEQPWVREQESRLPILKGRLQAFIVPGGRDGATFRDPETGKLLRARVVQVLALGKP